MEAIPPNAITTNAFQQPLQYQLLYNRRLRFLGNNGTFSFLFSNYKTIRPIGKSFCSFQIFSKRSGGYEGIIRVGKCPDTGNNGDIIRYNYKISRYDDEHDHC
jgi:hypothetical protein